MFFDWQYPFMNRVFVYIDGCNFYYGAVNATPYKWIDFKSLCSKLLKPEDKIVSIKYFTALVSKRGDKSRLARQTTYINALKTYITEIEIYYGYFLSHKVCLPLSNPIPNKAFEYVIKTEEKSSDVNLAIQLLNDAWLDLYDTAFVVSNDSDLTGAIKLVKHHHGHKVIGIGIPWKFKNKSKQLQECADFIKPIKEKHLSTSQLPDPIPYSTIHKPPSW